MIRLLLLTISAVTIASGAAYAAFGISGGLAGVSQPQTLPPAPMQPKESAIPSMARVLLHSRHCILTERRMRRSGTGDNCTDYAWPCTLRLRAHIRRQSARQHSHA
jgi:hypothetical protein